MLHRTWMIFAVVLMSASVPLGIAQFRSALAAGEANVPRLADIMNAAQTRHMKLYLAGKAQNWDLADYELQLLRTNITDAALLYADIPVSNVTKMVEPLNAIEDAIKAKDSRRFDRTVAVLTEGCNSCHQSMNRGFIVIRLPTEQPFGNQLFPPQGKK
jgi:hypothetical protein